MFRMGVRGRLSRVLVAASGSASDSQLNSALASSVSSALTMAEVGRAPPDSLCGASLHPHVGLGWGVE